MAASSGNTKKKSQSRGTAASRTAKKKTAGGNSVYRNRMGSTVLFILGVFLLFLTWIKGEAFWAGMQSALWGLFGVSSVLLSPIVIYVAVMMALDRSKSAVIVKVLQGALLILLVGPMFEIFYSMSKGGDSFSGDGFSGIITRLYENGSIVHQGGGALSIFLRGSLV